MKLFNALLFVLFALTIVSCSKDDPSEDTTPEITIADFVGSWKASSAVFTNNSDASQTTDFIAAGGEIRFTMLADGRVRTWIEFQNTAVDEYDAQASLQSGDILKITPAESSRPKVTWTYDIDGDEITFTNTDAVFDFTYSQATPISATSVMVFYRN